MKEERLHLDQNMYNSDAEKIMRQRGIINNDETIEDVLYHTIDTLSEIDFQLGQYGNDDFRLTLTELIGKGIIVLGTPLLKNIRSSNSSAAACTVLKLPAGRHFPNNSELLQLSNLMFDDATGVGFDFSDLDHPTETLLLLNDYLNAINNDLQSQKKRPVASMATIRNDHPEVLQFIRCKRDVDFSVWRVNISVFVCEDLFRVAEQDGDWYLRNKTGETIATIKASVLLMEIADCAHYCGEPGILFKDRLDVDNPTPQWNYISTAPCAELAMAEGDACHFSYINIGKLVNGSQLDMELFIRAATCLTRLLDAATECTVRGRGDILWLVKEKRRIGVGITGFADLLMKLKINYDSDEAQQIAGQIAESLDFYTKKESVALAQARGVFPSYENSQYKNRKWLQRKLGEKALHIPRETWEILFDDILAYGIRNASTTSMPPTGTSSEIVGVSKSLEPYFSFRNVYGNTYKVFTDFFNETALEEPLGSEYAYLKEYPYIKLAGDIAPIMHIRIQSMFQSFLDDGVSKTINLSNRTSREEIYQLLFNAYNYKLKGITVFRDNCLNERKIKHAL
jgi:ribonucleoside-diphosphate reductase alpha chain